MAGANSAEGLSQIDRRTKGQTTAIAEVVFLLMIGCEQIWDGLLQASSNPILSPSLPSFHGNFLNKGWFTRTMEANESCTDPIETLSDEKRGQTDENLINAAPSFRLKHEMNTELLSLCQILSTWPEKRKEWTLDLRRACRAATPLCSSVSAQRILSDRWSNFGNRPNTRSPLIRYANRSMPQFKIHHFGPWTRLQRKATCSEERMRLLKKWVDI